jgi:hypothetical protein
VALLGEPTAARRRSTRDGGELRLNGAETAARQQSGRRGFGLWRSERALSGRRLGRDGGARGEAVVERAGAVR